MKHEKGIREHWEEKEGSIHIYIYFTRSRRKRKGIRVRFLHSICQRGVGWPLHLPYLRQKFKIFFVRDDFLVIVAVDA